MRVLCIQEIEDAHFSVLSGFPIAINKKICYNVGILFLTICFI